MDGLNIAIMGEMPARGYSGGRYHAWIMAEALAHEGNQVYIITNNRPEFSKDFESYPMHKKVKVILTGDFYRIPLKVKEMDYVICVPCMNAGKEYYKACQSYAILTHARFSFINFESPNWFRAYSETERPEGDNKILRQMCRHGCLIFNSAKESQKYAVEYYNAFPQYTEYCVWSPPINSIVADKIKEERRNQILIFLRIKDKHKGGDDFLQLIGESMRSFTLVCIVGNGEIAQDFFEEAMKRAERYEIELRFEKSLSDYRKFQEMKRSKLLLFPSRFEGYGYPPVEALYCGTKCIAYDLPVLREVSGDALNYCEIGNAAMMQKRMEKLLKEPDIEPLCVDTAEFSRQAERVQHILEENLSNPKLIHRRSFGIRAVNVLERWYKVKIKGKRNKKIVPEIIKYCIDNKITISRNLNNNMENWRSIKKQIRGKEVYIWGCGRAYSELYPKYKNRFRIMGILDRNPDKIGTRDRVSGTMIIQNPDILKRVNKKETVVFISNKENVDAIIDELEKMKIEQYHSLCMMEINSLVGKIYRILSHR